MNKFNCELLLANAEILYFLKFYRGKELAMLLEPRLGNLSILGLGTSIGTAPEGLQAEVLVVKSFDELNAKAKLVFSYALSSCLLLLVLLILSIFTGKRKNNRFQPKFCELWRHSCVSRFRRHGRF